MYGAWRWHVTVFRSSSTTRSPMPAAAAFPRLLVHGLGDEADTWRHVLPALAAQRRAIAVDLPGFGRSDKPDAPYSVPWYAGVLLDLLDTLQIERVALAGHSLGAVTSHWLALEQPARIERLALLDGGLVAKPGKLDLGTMLFPGAGHRGVALHAAAQGSAGGL